MREITVKVYAFAELSDDAKERALNAFRDINVDFPWWWSTLIGLDIDRIYFDTDLYCIFNADYEYVRGAAKAIQAEFPHATDLHEVARKLQDLQKRHFYSLSCNVSSQRVSNLYRCFRFGEDYECEALGDLLDDFAHWARILLRGEYKYLTSDEAVKEMIESNEYEFDEAGNLL